MTSLQKPRTRRWQHRALLSWPHGTTTGANGSGSDRVVGDALTRVRTGSTATALEDGPFRRPTTPSPAAGSDPLSKCPEPGLAWEDRSTLERLVQKELATNGPARDNSLQCEMLKLDGPPCSYSLLHVGCTMLPKGSPAENVSPEDRLPILGGPGLCDSSASS